MFESSFLSKHKMVGAAVIGVGLVSAVTTAAAQGDLTRQSTPNETPMSEMGSKPGMTKMPATGGVSGSGQKPESSAVKHNLTRKMAGMGNMSGMAGMGMFSSVDLLDPMSRESSGTAWIPDSSPMYGKMFMLNGGKDMLMAHGGIFPRYVHAGSNRGGDKLDAPNWFMGMYSHPLDANSQLGLRLMMSLDPLTESKRGYPLLFQTGETAGGGPLHDRQHPHDLFDELSATYSRSFGPINSAYLYLGYPGEPALGPPTFMHRPSAMDDPDAPIGHHWQDSTHITFGVVTAGMTHRNIKFEGSIFNGSEPDEYRYNFDPVKLNSYSGRLSWNPDAHLSLQVSHGFIKSPEALEPGVSEHRTTASILYNKPLGSDANWSNSFVWGQNNKPVEGQSNSFLLESDYQRGANTLYARLEQVQKSGDELVLGVPALQNQLFSVGAYTAGYVRDLRHGKGIDVGLGGQVTVNSVPGGLTPFYGSGTPVGFQVFFRLRPSKMGGGVGSTPMGSMPGMKINPSSASSSSGAVSGIQVNMEAASLKPGSNTLTITVLDKEGKPVAGAKVRASVSMTSMDMGTTHPTFKDVGNGRYSGMMQFSMNGPWRLTVNVKTPQGATIAQTFDLNVSK